MRIVEKAKNKAKNKVGKELKKIAFKVIKPVLPFIIIIIGLFFAICTIIDAVFIQEVQADDSNMTQEELAIKNMCISKADYLNTCNNYKDGEQTPYLLDVSDRERDKMIEWSHLYSIIAFANMSNNKKLNEDLVNEVAKHFKSTFIYETNVIVTERVAVDDEGNTQVTTEEQIQYLLIESDSIVRTL